jgi:hypothetical protein
MNLISYLNSRDIKNKSIFALSITTTGFKAKKDKLVSISVQCIEDQSPSVVYVGVEDAGLKAAALNFNKISATEYEECKHTPDCAKQALDEMLKECRLLLSYSFDHFTNPFLETCLGWKPSCPVLDISAYAASLRKDEALFELPSSSSLEGYIHNLNRTTALSKRECSFTSLVATYCQCPELDAMSFVIKRPVQLIQIFNNLALQ